MQFGYHKRSANLSDGYTLSSGLTLGTMIGNWCEIESCQKSAKRKPTFSVFIEGVGDVTGDVTSVDVDCMITDSLHQPSYGHGNLMLADPSGKYNDGGVSLIDNKYKCNVFAGFNDLNIPIWSGMVTDSSIDTGNHTVNVSLSQSGYILGNPAGTRESGFSTSGDLSAYNTPKLLIDYLMSQAGQPPPVYENESGQPSTVNFGETYQDNTRTYWAYIHGSCLNMFYIPFFDINGILQLKRREGFTDVDYLYDDYNTSNIQFVNQAELVNQKIIDYSQPLKFEFMLSDNLYVGQSSRSKSNAYSKGRWGEHTDAETDPLIGSWAKAGTIIDEILDYFPYMRLLYDISAPGIPQLELLDRGRVKSDKQNISGKFIILGRKHRIRPGYYATTDRVISSGERL